MVYYISPYIATQREYDSIGSFFESLSVEEQTKVLTAWADEIKEELSIEIDFDTLYDKSRNVLNWAEDEILDCIIENTKGLYSCHTMYYDQEAVYFITEWTK